jgi:transketolase
MTKWRVGERVQTRDAYGEALLELGRRRDDIVVMDSDLQRSNKTYAFGQAHPERFFDMGIAEADMVCTAAGVAATGLTVFATSFAMFVPGRAYDQIRLQLGYARENVKIVGVSAGLTQGPDGATHQSLDDIGLTRMLPGLTVLVPADATEAYQAVIAAAEFEGPVYIRLGRYPTPVLFGEDYRFEIGAVPVMRRGGDVVIYATGIMTALALDAAAILEGQGVEATVLNVSTLKPLDTAVIVDAAQGKRLAVTMEEHWISGGLGSAVAETLAELHGMPPLLRVGVEDQFGQSATADELLVHYGLAPSKVVETILSKMEAVPGVTAAP